MKKEQEKTFVLRVIFLIEMLWQIVMLVDGVKYDLFPKWLTAIDLSVGVGLFIVGIVVAVTKKVGLRGWLIALLPVGTLAMVSVLLILKLMYY